MPISNFVFIDGNNLHLTFIGLGIQLKYDKLLSYLKKRHNVTIAYYFMGRVPQNQHIYDALSSYGYTLAFRDVTKKGGKSVTCPVCGKTFEVDKGKTKCDCDADLVLQVMDEINNYDKAIIITSDGDFDNLVKKLISLDKLDMVLSPSQKGCSHLLSSAARGRIAFLDKLIDEIEKY
ncbi:MAG: NYN domain-containing protein [Dehalococcoidia bacterium]|nr:NYN domain-containing protein [Dehalococcoidia bacterium]MDD5493184.1 NYN domain-containing protein [Dehalococcoidia bacterium]